MIGMLDKGGCVGLAHLRFEASTFLSSSLFGGVGLVFGGYG